MEDIGQTIHDYQLITQQQIDQYRTSNNYKVYIKTGIPQQHKANYPPSDEDPTLAAFKRGIKRDPTHFNSFKRDSDWDDWEAHIRITATGQGVEEILDNNYVPKNKDDKTLFLEKQKYMFQVFHTKVHTDKGKELIRQHLKDFDAQEVFHQLKIHGDKSISAKIKASDLLTYITSSNIADGSWRGTTIGYITHWKEQIRLYHKKLEPGEFFSDDQKRTMLQNAVQQIPELRQVKVNADTLTAFNGKSLTFDDYDSLLQSAAVQHDSSRASAKTPTRTVAGQGQHGQNEAGARARGYHVVPGAQVRCQVLAVNCKLAS